MSTQIPCIIIISILFFSLSKFYVVEDNLNVHDLNYTFCLVSTLLEGCMMYHPRSCILKTNCSVLNLVDVPITI